MSSDQAHRRLARVYVHLGFFEEAMEHADIALAIKPSYAQALNTRAQALLWMGNDERALATLLSIPGPVLPELVEANPVFALLRLGRRAEAKEHLARALSKYPNDSACACARMGRAHDAVAWLREAAETGFPCHALFARDPNLDRIRDDGEFRGFMAQSQKRSATLRAALFP